MVLPLACFASRGNYPVIRMMKSEWFPLFNVLPVGRLSNDQDDEIGMVPPLAYFASGRNCPMIRMMTSEYVFMLPYLSPFA